TLHYADEVRDAEPFFSDIPAKSSDPELLDVATALIDKKSAPFDVAKFKDHYHAALRELIARKMKSKGRLITADEDDKAPAKASSNVIDLMSALKQSLKGGKAAAKSGRKPKAKAAPRKKAS